MMHTIIDLTEVYDEHKDPEEKLDDNLRNIVSFDAMRRLYFNGS